MGHSDIINVILKAEWQAKEMLSFAENRRTHLEEDVDNEISEIHKAKMEEAAAKIGVLRENTQKDLEKRITELDLELECKLASSKDVYLKNEANISDRLLDVIINEL